MSVIGIALPDDSICQTFWFWSQLWPFFFCRYNFRSVP